MTHVKVCAEALSLSGTLDLSDMDLFHTILLALIWFSRLSQVEGPPPRRHS